MPVAILNPGADAWTNQQKAAQNNPRTPRLRVQSTASGAGKHAYLYFAPPFVPGSGVRVLQARLDLRLANDWGGSQTITAKRITASWQEGKITWRNAPSVSNANAASVTVSNKNSGELIHLDLTDMFNDVAAGAAYYGIRLESSRDADRRVYSSNSSSIALRPTLVVEFRPPVETVTPLAPIGGQAVSTPSPTLTWRVDADDDEFTQAASQVQIASSENGFDSPDYDSGEVANVEGQWSLEGEYTLTEGVPFFWRVRVKDDTGQWSAWSDIHQAVYGPKGTVTIISPPKVEVRRNLCTNPRAAAGTTGVINGGLASIDADEAPTLDGLPAGIATAYHCVATAAGQSIRFPIPVVSGSTYRFSFYFRAGATGLYQLHAVNGAGALKAERIINALGITIPGSVQAEPLGAFVRVDVGFTADSTDTWTLRANASVASDFWVAAVLAEEAGELGPYFDGDGYVDDGGRWREDTTGEEVEWDGEPHASPSVRYDRFVEDMTPVYVWDVAGVTQEQWKVEVHELPREFWGPLSRRVDSGWRTGDETQFRHPEYAPLRTKANPPIFYELIVRVRDETDRTATPGDPPYMEARRVFYFKHTSALTPIATLDYEVEGPAVILEWTEAEAADYYAIKLDGEVVATVYPEETRVSGHTHRKKFWLGTPGIEQEWEVVRVVESTHPAGWVVARQSRGNPTVNVTTISDGVWLVDTDDDTAVRLVGIEGLNLELHEVGETFDPIGSPRRVRITDVIGGYRGSFEGQILKAAGNPLENRDNFLRLRARQKVVRMIAGDVNIPVRLEEMAVQPTHIPTNEIWDASFSFFQVGEFDKVVPRD